MCEGQTYDLIISRRTVRRFKPLPVPRDVLEGAVNAGRLAPSASNLQPLEFVAVEDEDLRRKIFPCLRWAAYIAPAGTPRPGEEPMAYIVTLVNAAVRAKGFEYDAGAANENMILAAWSEGVGSCWLISVDKEKVHALIGAPPTHRVDSVLALGYPAEEPAVEDYVDSPKYWRDAAGRHHVPKRPFATVFHLNRFGQK